MKINKFDHSMRNISCAEDFEKYEDDIREIGQEFTSENTSINSTKLPAIFKLVSFKPGTTNLDYGGGRFDNVAEYLAPLDVINLVYDPYNRSAEHNAKVVRLVKEGGGADTVTCSNVLNVIKEPEVRLNVLENIKKLVKPTGEVYITVYEGSGKGDEGPTKAGYQLNRKTADYLDEIRQVFPDAKKKGKLIIAHPGQTVQSAVDIKSERRYYGGAYDIDPYQYFSKQEIVDFGDDTAVELSQILKCDVQLQDIYIVDYSRVVVEFMVDNDFEIDAQFNIDMRRIKKPSDIYKYQDAVMQEVISEYEAYVGPISVDSASEITCMRHHVIDRHGFTFGPFEEYDEPIYLDDLEETISIHVDDVIRIEDGYFYFVKDEFPWSYSDGRNKYKWESDNIPHLYLTDSENLVDVVADLLYPNMPVVEGDYHITADVDIVYLLSDIYVLDDEETYRDVEPDEVTVTVDLNKSKLKDLEVEPI